MIYGNYYKGRSKIKFLRKNKSRNRFNHSASDFYSTLEMDESLVLVYEEGKKIFCNSWSSKTVTALEIERGEISLIKWTIKADEKGSLFVGRDIIGGPIRIENY